MTEYRKKLIEVALPLADINDASAYDKMPGIGAHPKNKHHWWANRELSQGLGGLPEWQDVYVTSTTVRHPVGDWSA